MKFAPKDIELLEKLKGGEPDALRHIFNKYWKALYAYASKFVRDEYAADEIVQKLFIRLWEKRTELTIQSLSQYLYMSVKNGCIDYVRSQISREAEWEYYSQFLTVATISPEEEYLSVEIFERVKLLLGQLPKKSKEIFEKSRIDGLTVSQIAQLMKLSKKTVEYHLTKANKLIKSVLRIFIGWIFLADKFRF